MPGMAPTPTVQVDEHVIGAEHPPFVIAEMSGNHNGSIARALEIVDAVARTGAQALKLQTYTADTLTIDVDRPAFRVASDTTVTRRYDITSDDRLRNFLNAERIAPPVA